MQREKMDIEWVDLIGVTTCPHSRGNVDLGNNHRGIVGSAVSG